MAVIKLTVNPNGLLSQVTIDGQPVHNVVRAYVDVTPRGATVSLELEGAAIEVEGEAGAVLVSQGGVRWRLERPGNA